MDNRHRNIALLFTTIPLPICAGLVTEALVPQFRWMVFLAGVALVFVVLLTWPGSFLSRERHGRSRFVKYLSLAMFAVYCLLGGWIGVKGPQDASIYLCLLMLWASVTVLVLNCVEQDGRLGEIAGGMGALLIGAAYLIHATREASQDFEGTSTVLDAAPTVFLGIAWFMVAGALIRHAHVLLGYALLANGLCDLILQAVAFSDGDELFGTARLLKGVAFVLAGYAWLAWSKRAGAGALLLFGTGWVMEAALKVLEGEPVMALGHVLLGGAFLLLAALIGLPRRLGRNDHRWSQLAVAAAMTALALVAWGVAWLVGGQPLLGIGHVLVGLGGLTLLTNVDLRQMSRYSMFNYWFGVDETDEKDGKGHGG